MPKREGMTVKLLKDCHFGLEGMSVMIAKAQLAGMVARGECERVKGKGGKGPAATVKTVKAMPKKPKAKGKKKK